MARQIKLKLLGSPPTQVQFWIDNQGFTIESLQDEDASKEDNANMLSFQVSMLKTAFEKLDDVTVIIE